MKAYGILIGRIVFVAASCVAIVLAGGGMSFLRRPVGVAYLALWAVWWVITTFGRQHGEASSYDRAQRLVITISGIVSVPFLVLVPPWEYVHFAGPLPRDGPLAWAGLALFAAGIVLQSSAMWSIRGFYTVRLGVRPGQRLATTGPYRLVRHPGYLSYLLSLTGIGIAMGSLTALVLTILVVPFIVWRIRGEEAMLVAEFGDEYRAYVRRTRRLVPFIY